MTAVPLAPVRRWIGSRQSAHRERGATAGNIYFTVLFVAVVGGMLHNELAAVFWPIVPNASALAGAALHPDPVRRPLPGVAPVRPARAEPSRRVLAAARAGEPAPPAAAVAAAHGAGGGLVGALAGIAIVGHVAPRTLDGETVALLDDGRRAWPASR